MNTHPLQLAQYIIATANKVATGQQSYLSIDNLSDMPDWALANDANGIITQVIGNIDAEITTRDFIRLTFANLGIEIEFSGRDQYEKGVIIDIDEERISMLNLNADDLKFGQTAVRISAENVSPDELVPKQQ